MENQRNEFTFKLLNDNLSKGMNVLDIGCGTGDLTFIASDIVENNGKIIGIDINDDLLDIARTREKHIDNIEFITHDINTFEGKFDAIIARRVLMYQKNPRKTLKHLYKQLNDKGIMIFQESDINGSELNDCEKLPLHFKVQNWIWDCVKKEGGHVNIGSELYGLLNDLNMEVDSIKSEIILQTCEDDSDLAFVVSMMKERMEKFGIIDETTDNLENKLKMELCKSKIPFVRDLTYGIVAHK